MSETTKYSGVSTNLIHVGERPDPTTGSVIPPIYQTTTFAFETNESIFDLMEGRSQGYIYTRYGNPNYTMVEAKIAHLEEAESGLVLASGMAASSTAVLAILKAGDHLITHADIYELAKIQMTDFGSVMSIELKGGQDTINKVLNKMKLFTRAVSLGSVESLIT